MTTHRRKFLTTFGAATLGLGLRHLTLAEEIGNSQEFPIALFSDTHIHANPGESYRGFRPYDNLIRTVRGIVATNAQFALLCGDAARLEGRKEDYQSLQGLLAPIKSKMNLEIALGNHDDRENFFSVFGQSQTVDVLRGKKHVVMIDFAVQRWILLDSLMYVDKAPGHLGKEQRDWLDQILDRDASKPIVLMVHHTLGDGDGDLLDGDRLLTIAHSHPHVKAIVYGHSHRWNIQREKRLWLINLPAVGYNFEDEQPLGWILANLGSTGMSLKLHAIGGDLKSDQSITDLRWIDS